MKTPSLRGQSKLICSLILILGGCEGDDGGGAPTFVTVKQNARYVNVEGLMVESGTTQAPTGPAGEFVYESVREECRDSQCNIDVTLAKTTFRLMVDVELPGSGTPPLGQFPSEIDPELPHYEVSQRFKTWFVSPFNVSEDLNVRRNLALVMSAADADGNPDNGIQIPEEVRMGTYGGPPLNWETSHPRTDFEPLRAAIKQLHPAGSHEWPATDEEPLERWASAWNCAMVGRYAGEHASEQTFIDTNGITRKISGAFAAEVTPVGLFGIVKFSQAPWEFDGFFRQSGALEVGTVTASSVHYVDAGQYAPQVYQPIVLTTTFQFSGYGHDEPTGIWNAGGYRGAVGRARRNEWGYEGILNEKTGRKGLLPFNGLYRFMTPPLWLRSNPLIPNAQGVAEFFWQLEISSSGQILAALDRRDRNLPPDDYALSDLGASNTLSIAFDKKASDGRDTVGATEFVFNGSFDLATMALTGTLILQNGISSIVWDASHPLVGCSTRGRPAH